MLSRTSHRSTADAPNRRDGLKATPLSLVGRGSFITMFLTVQFPIVDSRPFLDQETGMLHRPNWPSPLPDEDFVRSFGHIRQRRRGGLPNWVGESEVCEANRAIRFDRPPPFTVSDYSTTLELPVKIIFRRFYKDGFGVCKYEIGFVIRPRKDQRIDLDPSGAEALLRHILQLSVTIPDPTGSIVRRPLWNARAPLAHLYQVSSTFDITTPVGREHRNLLGQLVDFLTR